MYLLLLLFLVPTPCPSAFTQKTKPVIFSGDLNVAHLDSDIWNPTAKHIAKSAGTTPQERSSFSTLLGCGFTDSLRHFYPDAKGQFTYWSQRANGRPVNRGLRLDYFVCSNDLFDSAKGSGMGDSSSGSGSSSSSSSGNRKRSAAEVSGVARIVDSFILVDDTLGYSDHAPVVLILQV